MGRGPGGFDPAWRVAGRWSAQPPVGGAGAAAPPVGLTGVPRLVAGAGTGGPTRPQAHSEQERGMNTRLDDPSTTTEPIVRGILIVTITITIVGVLALVRAGVGGGVDHVTVRVDNQAGLAVQVDAVDASGDTVGLGGAERKSLTTFQEVPDIGPRWTLVATYGGQQVHRQTLARAELAARNWTVTIPASATSALERAGLR